MNKTSHKKNRPFDFKLIDLVEPHPVLYMRQMPGMTPFDILKAKNKLWQEISAEMGFDRKLRQIPGILLPFITLMLFVLQHNFASTAGAT